MLALQRFFRFLKLIVKAAVELVEHVLPKTLALLDIVKRLLHARGKVRINNIRKALLHELCDNLAQNRRAKIFAFLEDIFAVGDRADGGRIGAGPSNALFLHRTDKRSFRIAGGRLGKQLLGIRF